MFFWWHFQTHLKTKKHTTMTATFLSRKLNKSDILLAKILHPVNQSALKCTFPGPQNEMLIIFLTKWGSSFLAKNTLMQLHHIRGIMYLLILFIAGYLHVLFLFYTVHVPNSNFQEYFKYFVTGSHKFIPLFIWHHICHFGVPNQSSGSCTLFLCKHFLLFTTWVKTLNSGEAQNMEQSKTNQNKYIYSESTESNGNSYQMWLILCHLSQTVERQSCAEHWDHTVKPQMLRIHWRISTYKGEEDKGQTPWKNCYTSIVHNVHVWERALIFMFHCKNYTQQHHQRQKILSLNNDNIK